MSHETGGHGPPDTRGPDRLDLDVAAVERVGGFYRRSSMVLGAAAQDMSAHDFGTWASGERFGPLGARLGAQGRELAQRLAHRAAEADRLAALIGRAVAPLVDADETAAHRIASAASAAAAPAAVPSTSVPPLSVPPGGELR